MGILNLRHGIVSWINLAITCTTYSISGNMFLSFTLYDSI